MARIPLRPIRPAGEQSQSPSSSDQPDPEDPGPPPLELLERWELERILNELERFFRETPSGGFPSPGRADSPYYKLIRSKDYLPDAPRDALHLRTWLEEKRGMSPPEQEKYVRDQIKDLGRRVNQLLRSMSDTSALPGKPAGTAREPKGTTDNLTPNDWKLLRAMGGLKAIDSEHATSREKIVRKAKTGDPESKHNRESFKRLKDLGLIDAAQRIGTWLTEGGLSLLENKYR